MSAEIGNTLEMSDNLDRVFEHDKAMWHLYGNSLPKIPEWATSLIRTGFDVVDEVADVNPDTIKNPEGAKVIVVTCEARPDGKVSTKQYKAYLAKLQENPNYKAPLQHNTEKKHKQKCKKFNKARMKNKIFNDEMIHNMRVQQKQELEAEQALVTAPSLLA